MNYFFGKLMRVSIKPNSQQKANERRGSAMGNSRLTEEQVRTIRASSLQTKQLAAIFKVTKGFIDGIRSGRTWKHVKL
jgi:hypothetical protein